MNNFFGSEKVIIRFISLYTLGLILFFISWTIAYYFLPESLLRGSGLLPGLAGDTAADTLFREFIQILLINTLGFILILGGNYILRVKNFSFGYLVPLAWMIKYGLTLGTNSFLIPMVETMTPSLAVFGRAGLYEMMAAVLFAVATCTISINKSETFSSSSKKVPRAERGMKKDQWIAVGVALLILAAAAFREAYMIMDVALL